MHFYSTEFRSFFNVDKKKRSHHTMILILAPLHTKDNVLSVLAFHEWKEETYLETICRTTIGTNSHRAVRSVRLGLVRFGEIQLSFWCLSVWVCGSTHNQPLYLICSIVNIDKTCLSIPCFSRAQTDSTPLNVWICFFFSGNTLMPSINPSMELLVFFSPHQTAQNFALLDSSLWQRAIMSLL